MTTNMVKKRVRERSKLQPYPQGLSLKKWKGPCLVPRPHYSARPKRFGSRAYVTEVN